MLRILLVLPAVFLTTQTEVQAQFRIFRSTGWRSVSPSYSPYQGGCGSYQSSYQYYEQPQYQPYQEHYAPDDQPQYAPQPETKKTKVQPFPEITPEITPEYAPELPRIESAPKKPEKTKVQPSILPDLPKVEIPPKIEAPKTPEKKVNPGPPILDLDSDGPQPTPKLKKEPISTVSTTQGPPNPPVIMESRSPIPHPIIARDNR